MGQKKNNKNKAMVDIKLRPRYAVIAIPSPPSFG